MMRAGYAWLFSLRISGWRKSPAAWRSFWSCNITRFVLLTLGVMSVTVFTGCMSERVGAGLAPVVLEAAIKPMFEPPQLLAREANEFREAKKRWPKNYDELSSFLRHSDAQTFRQIEAVQFHSIHFSDLPDGRLRVDADYTVGSGTSVRINDMRISPCDPNDIKVMPITALTPTAP